MLKPGSTAPDIDLPLTIDARFVLSDQTPDAYTMLVFYRGKHCPICKRYLEELGGRLEDFTSRGINVFAISMDSEDRAMVVDSEWKTGNLPLVHSMTEEQAREWGLYISEKREGSEEPDVFSEPGLFLLKPDRSVYLAITQNMPITRPSLDELVEGIDFLSDKHYPTRGTKS